MPRKHPPRGYYEEEEEEEQYEVERDRRRPRRRSKRSRVVEEDVVGDYYGRRAPEPLVEDLERMRIRERPSLKESYTKAPPQALKFRRGRGEVKNVPPPPPSPPSERERDEYQPPPRSKKAQRGRKNKKVESDEYVYKEDPHGGRRGKGKQIAEVISDSDIDDISVRRTPSRAARRPPQPPPPPIAALPPADDDSDEEFARRERRRRKGKMPVEPEYVREEAVAAPPPYAHKPNAGRHRGKERGDARRAASLSRVRSWSSRRNAHESDESDSSSTTTTTESDTEDSEEEDDDEDDEMVVLKKEWGRGHRRDSSRAPVAIRSRKTDSSPGSPSLREASPEPAPRHHRRPKYIEQEYEVVQPPPPPALEPLPSKGNYELEVRHRGRKGRSQDDSVLVPRHGRGDPYMMEPPPPPRESSRRRKKVEETQIAPIKPQAIDYGNYERDLALRERSHRVRDARAVRDDMELDLYSRRRPELAPYPRPPSGPTAGDLSLMGAPGPVPGAIPGPRPRSMPRGPHPNEMGWPQPRDVPHQRYYPQPEEFSDEEEIEDGQAGPGRRYIGMKDRRDRLWTEITKDLVVRDAVERFGYEYEETDYFFYIFSYLQYEDVAALVELSDQIRHARRRRIHEINRGRGSYPPAHPQVPQMPQIPPVAAAPAPGPAPVASGPMGPMAPMAPVAPVPPPGYEKYAAAAAAAAAAAGAAPPPPPPPMMNHPQPWPWDGGRLREREMVYDDSRWRAPGAWPRW